MTDTQRLKELWRPVAVAIRTDDELRRMRATQVAINADGSVNPDAIASSLPWQVRDASVAVPAIGVVPGIAWRFPQGATIHRLDAIASTAPTSGAFNAWITVQGSDAENVSIAQGEAVSPGSGASIIVPSGGIVRWRVSAAGGAKDVMLSIFYTAGGV